MFTEENLPYILIGIVALAIVFWLYSDYVNKEKFAIVYDNEYCKRYADDFCRNSTFRDKCYYDEYVACNVRNPIVAAPPAVVTSTTTTPAVAATTPVTTVTTPPIVTPAAPVAAVTTTKAVTPAMTTVAPAVAAPAATRVDVVGGWSRNYGSRPRTQRGGHSRTYSHNNHGYGHNHY